MFYKQIILPNKTAILIKAVLVCSFILAASGSLLAQYKGSPVTLDRLVGVLRSKQLNTSQIVEVINNKGVDFQLNGQTESQLVAAGARPAVIEAIRANYRADVAAKPTGKTASNSTNGKTKFTGSPLNKDAIITLLDNGVADAQVRKNVAARGVNFKANSATIAEIKKAGGSVALINLIGLSYVNQNAANSGTSGSAVSAQNPVEDYDSLIDKAVDLYDKKQDKNGAVSTLQQAIKLDASNARAYQLLGFMNLYGFSNFAEAERNMQEAIARGGNAVFRVFHDHDGFFQETCTGSLYVGKDAVKFESDDNAHTFQTNDSDIQKIKTNSAFKRAFQTKQGSFQIVLKSGDEKNGVKFSFAPLTDNIAESKMVIRLIGKNE